VSEINFTEVAQSSAAYSNIL